MFAAGSMATWVDVRSYFRSAIAWLSSRWYRIRICLRVDTAFAVMRSLFRDDRGQCPELPWQ